MKMTEYARSKGLTSAMIAQEMGVTRQALDRYGNSHTPTAKTLKKVAAAMTALGVPTTAVDVFRALEEKENEYDDFAV